MPEGSTVPAFLTSVKHYDGHCAAFLISFAVIASAWSNHHDLFRYVTDSDARTRFLNICWLFTIVLNPFATKLLVVSGQTLGTHALRFGFYAFLQALESAALYLMLRHMIAHGLAAPSPPAVRGLARQSLHLVLGFGLSIPVFFVTTYGWVLWLATPVLAGVYRHRRP